VEIKGGEQETGRWATGINVAPKGLNEQADAAISYPCALPNSTSEQVHVVYMTETKVEEGGLAGKCEGSSLEPEAEEGYLCVYRAANTEKGAQETEDTEVAFFALESAEGVVDANQVNVQSAITSKDKEGEFVVFRTTNFEAGTGPKKELTKAAGGTFAGSWAVRPK
jgi:hypothetical protein